MAAARRVGVGKLIDKNDLWPASDNGIEVHFLKPLALVLKAPARNDIETFQQCFGLFPAMSLHDADDNIVAVFASGTGLLQHFVGLADARRRTHEDLELTDATLFPPGRLKQGFRRGSSIKVATLVCHQTSGPCDRPRGWPIYFFPASSSARLSSRTFTRGSPSRPRARPSVRSPTSWRKLSSGMLRAFATRGTWNKAAAGEM